MSKQGFIALSRGLPNHPIVGFRGKYKASEACADYVGESSVKGFLRRVGKGEYPKPQIAEGRRLLWLRDDLDAAILPSELAPTRDVAGDL
jgi:hypothetical protein